MPRVIVSSGHTSSDPGIIANDLREYDIARNVAKATTAALRKGGIITLAVPPDMDLAKRISWANNTGYQEEQGDVAIEIHMNEGKKSGFEVWYRNPGDNPSQRFAKKIAEEVAKGTQLKNTGVKNEIEHEGGAIAFLADIKSTACLIKCAYLDNEQDAKFLKVEANVTKLGESIAKGIQDFIKNNKVPPPDIKARPGNPFAVPIPDAPPNPTNMSRDDRKKMIVATYLKILGREPNENDINYFLNISIQESDLVKKMIDSQEHADLVKTKKDFDELKLKHDSASTELSALRSRSKDQDKLMQNLQQSILHKNYALAQMQQRLNFVIQKARQMSQNNAAPETKTNYKGTMLDRLFKTFSDMFE